MEYVFGGCARRFLLLYLEYILAADFHGGEFTFHHGLFDWLFQEKEGKRFMEKLSETEDLSYFELDIVKNIIWFQWNKFLPAVFIVLFLPFLTFFGVFIVYTSYLLPEKKEEDKTWGDYYTATFV